MNKSPIKQIYLLLVIIGGFVSLSIYSTYALFTYEQITENVASISTVNSLTIDTMVNEYKRIKLEANSFATIDVNINNYSRSDLCYGVWYKLLGDYTNVYLYRTQENSISNGSIENMQSIRTSIIAINNNNMDVYINIGVNSSNVESCSLNLQKGAKLITEVYKEIYLNDYLLEQIDNEEVTKESEYKEIKNYPVVIEDDKLIVASNFEFKDGLFTLKGPYEIEVKDININDKDSYYFMLNDNNHEIYKVTSVEESTINTIKYIGFISSINGIIKYENNLEYYGSNPDNYICINNLDNDCELYRIIGLFYNKENDKYNVKVVRNDYLEKVQYSNKSNLIIDNNDKSTIYNYLLEYYDNNLTENTKNMIIEYTYKTDYNDSSSEELIDIYNYSSNNNYNLNVGLLSLTDYLYGSNCNDKKINEYNSECYINNWLYKYDKEMLINRVDDGLENIYAVSDKLEKVSYDTLLNIRPVLYLKDDINYILGDGTINNPFTIR